MSSILYRKGKGTFEHGVECESTTCEAGHVDGLLAAGWSTTPPGYSAPEPAPTVDDLTEGAPVADADGIKDVKEWLDSQIESLQEQVRILTDLDEASKSEVARLTRELDGVAAIEAERDQLKADVKRLNDELSKLTADEEDGELDPDANLHPVRIAAKEKGIEGWDTKRIATLEKMLEA